jgi:hypothetical protein
MRFEGPDISQIVALTGFVLSAGVILAILGSSSGRVAQAAGTIPTLPARPMLRERRRRASARGRGPRAGDAAVIAARVLL